MVASVREIHSCPIDGSDYGFRTPTVYDLPKIRRTLTNQGIRRPVAMEFEVAGRAGIEALGELAGDPDEAERQKEIFAEWHTLLQPLRDDDIDEPDFKARAEELARRLAERQETRARLLPQIAAIEANLARHWAPWRELQADRAYYDEISEIELVRALLVRIGDAELTIGADGLLGEATYQLLPRAHRTALAAFATRLLLPDEETRKN